MRHAGSRIAIFPPLLRTACCAAALAGAPPAAPDRTAPARAIGPEPQLLVDDTLLARKSGVTRKAHACRKLARPVLEPMEPWEQDGIDRRVYLYGTVLRDGPTGAFRMWYNRGGLVLHATSDDGLLWRRPRLGLHDHKGSNANNIVLPSFHSPSVVYDAQAPDPNRRYNLIGYGRVTQAGYCAAHSPDGLHWTLHPGNPILPGGDTCTLAHDPATGDYLAFHKRTHKHRGHNRRLVYLATSRDMQHWSEPRSVMAPDATDDARTRAAGGICSQFYNMSAFRRGGQWLGLVTHFRFTGRPAIIRGPFQSPDDGPIDVQLVHSRDGRAWQRCEDRAPVIPNGPHDYDAGCILGVANGPVRVGDELWIYYTAITTTHGGSLPAKRISIALAKWRLDRFVSLDAGPAGGTVETIPLHCPGTRLILNADAARGTIRVEALDAGGVSLAGYSADDCVELQSDGVRLPVRWKHHDTLPRDPVVRLRFHLRDAGLFSFQLAESTNPS